MIVLWCICILGGFALSFISFVLFEAIFKKKLFQIFIFNLRLLLFWHCIFYVYNARRVLCDVLKTEMPFITLLLSVAASSHT